jgi:hypothetical protein
MRQLAAIVLSGLMVMPVWGVERGGAQDPVAPASQIRERLRMAAEGRQEQIRQVERVFRHDAVEKALRSAKMDAGQVVEAASLLNSEDLARLAARSAQIERDLAAGAFSNQMLTYIVIALATAVLVLIIVV